jgi:hypothetical protein
MEFHIWDDFGGFPGNDLITPMMVYPEATQLNPNPMTRIDLRPWASELDSLSGDIYVGFLVPNGECWVAQGTPGIANRTLIFDPLSNTWVEIADDYSFRVITTALEGAPTADFDLDEVLAPEVAFTDLSTNAPNNWLWDFDFGSSTSTATNPIFTFPQNGSYNVCLTASNLVGSDQHCEFVSINTYPAPVADFTFDITNTPLVTFTDQSSNAPTMWLWDFDDGSVSIQQHPSHTYVDEGTYNVCLTASNANGTSAESCQDVLVDLTGIHTLESALQFNAYPNPAEGFVKVDINGLVSKLEITNMLGEVVKTTHFAIPALNQQATIDLTQLNSGIYLITAKNEEGKGFSKKLIVNK